MKRRSSEHTIYAMLTVISGAVPPINPDPKAGFADKPIGVGVAIGIAIDSGVDTYSVPCLAGTV